MDKKAIAIILLLVLLLSTIAFISAGPFQDELNTRIDSYTYPVPDKICRAFYCPFLKGFYKDFVIEVKTEDTNEDFFIVVKESNCRLKGEFIEKTRPDVLLSANSETGSYVIHPKTFKGMLARNRFQEFF